MGEKAVRRKLAELNDERLLMAAALELNRQERDELNAFMASDAYVEPDPEKAVITVALLEKEYAKVYRNPFRKVARILLVAALVMAIASSATVFARRVGFFDFLAQTYEEYSSVWGGSKTALGKPQGWESEYYPTWVPERYTLDEVTIDADYAVLYYADESDNKFLFRVNQFKDIHLNTEGMSETLIEVKGNEVPLYTTVDKLQSCIVLHAGNGTIAIEGALNVDEMERVVEKINSL